VFNHCLYFTLPHSTGPPVYIHLLLSNLASKSLQTAFVQLVSLAPAIAKIKHFKIYQHLTDNLFRPFFDMVTSELHRKIEYFFTFISAQRRRRKKFQGVALDKPRPRNGTKKPHSVLSVAD